MRAGTVVTPRPEGETIVGIAVAPFDDAPDSDWNVVWFSTQRGVFRALEAQEDLVPADLSERDEMANDHPDTRLAHAVVAAALEPITP